MAGFADTNKEFSLKFASGTEQTMRGVTIKLWDAIIKSSPVDSGRFRGAWVASDERASSEVPIALDPSGTVTTQAATSYVLGSQAWDNFTLSNNLPYAAKIEFGGYNDGPNTVGGFSKQAPQGVVRVNVARFNNLLNTEAAKNLP